MSCNDMFFIPANSILQTSQYQLDEDDNTHYQTPILPPQDFNAMLDDSGVGAFLGGKRSMHHLSGMLENQNGCNDTNDNNNNVEDELSDDGSLTSGDQKKKRLHMEQVNTLEKSFEKGNKLEPERKVQLAVALGLQPRQVAIWFQNRRARWKTKQLEKDYDTLKREFDTVKAQNESLQSQNQELQSQIQVLTSERGGPGNVVSTETFNLNMETIDQGSCSNKNDNEVENNSDYINMVKLDMSGAGTANNPGHITTSMALFPTLSSANTNSRRPNGSSNLSATQLFFQHSQQQHNVKDGTLSNMFCGIEDQSGFWPWLEHQQHFG